MAAARVAGVLVMAFRIHVSLRRLEALVQEKQRRDTLTEYRRDHHRLIGRGTEDPSLLPVLDAYEGDLHPDTQRRHLFANALYQHAYQGYQLGVLSLADLHGHLRYIFQSRAMREYWEATPGITGRAWWRTRRRPNSAGWSTLSWRPWRTPRRTATTGG
ncbi:DUF6082 family protein [Streptomyces sp. GLT-R25]